MHVPVMCAEVVELLLPRRGGLIVDCTVGLGGHARALLEAGAGSLIGLDRDAEAIARTRDALSAFGGRVELVHADFRTLPSLLDARGISAIDGVVADLGVSSLQLDGEGRGFSFQRDEPLDMRMDRRSPLTAADLVASLDAAQLADTIFRYGEERRSRQIARAIVAARGVAPIRTTGALAAIVRRAAPARGRQRIDPATRTFQALRIRVNEELDGLDLFITEACRRLKEGGRLVVIAFHSLEDRIVKQTLRGLERAGPPLFRVITRKVLRPGDDEVARNPRSRSARLRAIERLRVAGGANVAAAGDRGRG